ncbi:hypothetical protein SUGI_0718000 [Cryptomeria japonica]|nr:hypothetical protein SUGI_0718000 [Cryptomeria japonica]
MEANKGGPNNLKPPILPSANGREQRKTFSQAMEGKRFSFPKDAKFEAALHHEDEANLAGTQGMVYPTKIVIRLNNKTYCCSIDYMGGIDAFHFCKLKSRPLNLPFAPPHVPSSPPLPPASSPSPSPLPHNLPPSSSAPLMANSILDYRNVIKATLAATQPPPFNPSKMVDTPTHLSTARTLNAQQLVMEKLRKATEARKIIEQNLFNQKLEIEASRCQLPDLKDIDRGVPTIADTINRALVQDPELPTCKEFNGLNYEESPTLQGEMGRPAMEEVPTNPLDDSGILEASRGHPASDVSYTASTPIIALKIEPTTTQGVESSIDPFTPMNTNFEQGLAVSQDGFTMVKHKKSRRKRSPKNNKDSANRKESLGPEQISEERKKRGRPSSSIPFDVNNIATKRIGLGV